MLTRACLILALLAAMHAWSQVAPAATGGTPVDETQMQIPPPISGEPLPTVTGSEVRSNYLDPGLTLETAYYDNLLPGYGAHPSSDMAYSVNPNIELDKMTSRLHQTWKYESNFTLYQHTSARNLVDQNASLHLLYRLSQHVSISGRDTFVKGSNIFNQPSLGVSLSGSTTSSPADVIAPYADLLSNQANAQLSYQFSANSMIGAGGTTALHNYPNQAQSPDLANSDMRGGSAFYNRLLSSTQYIGAIYQYSNEVDTLSRTESDTKVDTFSFFYTAHLMHALTLSVTAGPERYNVAMSPLPPFASWTPSVTGSIAWQRDRTNFAASYSRTVAGGGGLLGAFSTNTANGSARWQLARTWTVEATVNYLIRKNVSLFSLLSYPGGYSVSGTAKIEHSLSEHFRVSLEYQRVHQSYSYISSISSDPDSDRGSISISYQFARPLGR